MAKTPNEAKDIITQVKNGFTTFETRVKERMDQLYRREAYTDGLLKDLDPSITTRISRPSKIPAIDARHTQGIIRASYQFHAAMSSDKDRAARKGDAIELYLAHLWMTKFDAGGKLFGPTRRDQTVLGAGLWWLEWDTFALPGDESKREEYRKNYDPLHLYRINPLTGYWMPDDSGKPTVAVREFEVPYIELAKRYGKDQDRDPLTILNEQFPGLRGARGAAIDASDLNMKKAKVCVVADSQTISHWVDVSGTYIEAYGEVANPFKRPPLFIIPGQYNPDGADYSEVYQPLMEEEYIEQRNLDVMVSHMASLAFTPNKYGQTLPPEAVALINEDKTIPPVDFKNGIASLYGKAETFGNDPGQSSWELLAVQIADRDATRPPPFLTNPDQAVIKEATLGAQLNAHETSNRLYDDARQHLIAGIVDVCDAIKTFWSGGYAGVAGEPVKFSPSGTEKTKVYAGEYRDKEVTITPEDWQMPYTMEVSIVASTQSQKALEYELKRQQVMDGAEEHEALIAVTTENVSGKKLKINEEKWFNKYVPVIENLTLLDTFAAIEKRDKLNLMPLAVQTGLVNPQMMGPQGDANIGGARTDPPSTAVPDAGAAV